MNLEEARKIVALHRSFLEEAQRPPTDEEVEAAAWDWARYLAEQRELEEALEIVRKDEGR
jgi:hypothetical protein